MNKIDSFKEFVKNNNHLVSYVRDNKKTWQELYELYDIYGEDKNIWDNYLTDEDRSSSSSNRSAGYSFNDFLNMAKNLDVDKVQTGIASLQKVIGLFGDLFVGDKGSSSGGSNIYEPRPIYKRFDD